MPTKTMFLIVLIVILFNISCSNADTCYCYCCSGNFCTATLQGTIPVPSCASSSCESVCQNKYPTQCTNGAGSTIYQCRGGSVSTPNWVGVFNIANKCDTSICCCPIGELILSRVGSSELRVQSILTGTGCSGASSLDATITMPSDFNTQILFLGNPIQVTLSQDSRTIQMNNPNFPQCSETAARNGPSSIGTINLASVFLLSSLMSFRQFML